jgi:hypothetical protein
MSGSGRRRQDSEPLELEDVLAQIPDEGGWMVSIYRRHKSLANGNLTDTWLNNWEPAQVSEAALAATYGAGKFVVRPYTDQAGAKGKRGASKTVDIDPEAAGVKQPELLVGAYDRGGDDEKLDALTRMQIENLRQNGEIQRQSNADMMKMLLAMIAAQGNGSSLDLGGIAALITATRPPADSSSPLTAVREVIGVAKELLPKDGGGEAGPWDILGQLVPGMVAAAADRPAALPAARVETRPPEEGPTDNPPARIATAEEQDGPEMQNIMKARFDFLAKLNQRAAAGVDPLIWADYCEDNQTFEEPAQWLITIARSPEAYTWPEVWATCLKALPAAAPNEQWFRSLYDALANPAPGPVEVIVDDSGASNSEGRGGNETDVDGNGKPSEGTADLDSNAAQADQ